VGLHDFITHDPETEYVCISCTTRHAHRRFVRVPGNYYERPLEWRRDALEAASVHHLCKVRGVPTASLLLPCCK